MEDSLVQLGFTDIKKYKLVTTEQSAMLPELYFGTRIIPKSKDKTVAEVLPSTEDASKPIQPEKANPLPPQVSTQDKYDKQNCLHAIERLKNKNLILTIVYLFQTLLFIIGMLLYTILHE